MDIIWLPLALGQQAFLFKVGEREKYLPQLQNISPSLHSDWVSVGHEPRTEESLGERQHSLLKPAFPNPSSAKPDSLESRGVQRG